VAGLLASTKGEVLVEGVKVEGVSRERGMVFQQYTSFDWLTVSENVGYGLKLAGAKTKEIKEQVKHYLEMVGAFMISGINTRSVFLAG